MQIHLLGYSEATLSRIFDALFEKNYAQPLIIVQNMKVEESFPFCPPGMSFQKLFWEDWSFDPSAQVCFPAVMNPGPKKQVIDFFRERRGIMPEAYCNIIHPKAVVANTAVVGNGCMIEPGAVIASFARLGFGVYINRECSVGHHTQIGDYTMTGPGVHIAGHCSIGNNVKLGIGAVVFDHVCIGDDTVVGGGSVVTKDLPAGVIAWGNPCKVMRKNGQDD